jgi:hypothetical protein
MYEMNQLGTKWGNEKGFAGKEYHLSSLEI